MRCLRKHFSCATVQTVPLILFVLIGCAAYGRVAGAQTTEVPGAEVRRIQSRLLQRKTSDMETGVPAAVQVDIVELKDSLTRLTDAVVAGLSPNVAADMAGARITARLPRTSAEAKAGPTAEDAPVAGLYGSNLALRAMLPQPDLLLVDEHFDIACGDDHVLLGYSNASGAWKRVLRWQAPPYKEISGAFGDLFEVDLLGAKRDGKPVLLVVHGTPWCTSTVSSFSMDTFAIDTARDTVQPFWHGEHDYRRADDVPPFAYRSHVTEDGWEIRASVSEQVGDGIARVGVMRYRLTQAGVERVLPLAVNARETVSEWLSLPRAEAARFTDAPAGSSTWRMYDTLTHTGKSDNAQVPSLSYGPVRACTDSPKHFQAEMDSEVYSQDNRQHAPGPRYFVQLTETGNGYRIADTLSAPAPACTGKPIQYGGGYAHGPA